MVEKFSSLWNSYTKKLYFTTFKWKYIIININGCFKEGIIHNASNVIRRYHHTDNNWLKLIKLLKLKKMLVSSLYDSNIVR